MRAFFASLRFRLVLWFALILAIVLAAFSGFVYVSQFRELQSESVTRIQGKLESLEGFIRATHELSPDILKAASDEGRPVLDENDILIFLGEDGSNIRLWGPSELDAISNVEFRQPTPDRDLINASVVQDGKSVQYAFMIVPLEGLRQAGFFLVGTPLDPSGQLQRLLFNLLLGSFAILVIALAGGFWLADRAMRPVREITNTAQHISESDLSLRLHIKAQDEIGQLAATFNGMLSRLETAFNRQRQFTADASHELRTPLTIINLELEHALANQRKSQEYQRSLKVIQSENDFMTHLVNDLLLLARMDSNQTPLQKETLDLSDVALEVMERLSSLAARNHVTLEAGDFPEVPLSADRQYIARMLTNLIENAIKYTATNNTGAEKKVCIETGCASTGTEAWVRVSDSGPGIPKENLPHLFDRFYRVDQSRARADSDSPSGVGLGLAIAQWIAHLHGGEIAVESELNIGTTFTVKLPMSF